MEDGLSGGEIGKRMGISRNTVNDVIRELKVTENPDSVKSVTENTTKLPAVNTYADTPSAIKNFKRSEIATRGIRPPFEIKLCKNDILSKPHSSENLGLKTASGENEPPLGDDNNLPAVTTRRYT